MPIVNKFKVVLIGDQNVGKTSLISKFTQDAFQSNPNPTVGIDFVTKTMEVQGQALRLQLWDTAGQERFRALIPSYVKDADTCLVLCDLSNRASFVGLDKWLDFVQEFRGPQALVYIVGNKSDIQQREVSSQQLQAYGQKHKFPCIQVSARNGTNVGGLFVGVAQRLIEGKMGKKKESKKEQKSKVNLEGSRAKEKGGDKCRC